MAMKDMLLLLVVSSLVSISCVIAHDQEGLHIAIAPGASKYSGLEIPPEAHHDEDHHHLAYIPTIAAMHSEVKLRRSALQKPPMDACVANCQHYCATKNRVQGPQSCMQQCTANC